jgi:hypothetical protein
MTTHVILNYCNDFLPTPEELVSLKVDYPVKLYLCGVKEVNYPVVEQVEYIVTQSSMDIYFLDAQYVEDKFVPTGTYGDGTVLDECEDRVIVVDYSALLRQTSFDQSYLGVMERLNMCRFDKRQYYTPQERVDLAELLEDEQSLYNPFDSKPLPEDKTIQSIVCYELMVDYAYAVLAFKKMGFDKMQEPKSYTIKYRTYNSYKERIAIEQYWSDVVACKWTLGSKTGTGIETLENTYTRDVKTAEISVTYRVRMGWFMNMSSRANYLLIKYFGLLPTSVDKVKFTTIEFAENAQYRQIVTRTMYSVICSFLISCDYASDSNMDRAIESFWLQCQETAQTE